MASSYPTALDTYPQRANGQVIDASHVNTLEDGLGAVQTVLGLNPQGSQLTVAARLTALETGSGTTPDVIDGGGPGSTFDEGTIDGGTP